MIVELDRTDRPEIWDLLSQSLFEVGGEDQLSNIRSKNPREPEDEEGKNRLKEDWKGFITDVQIRVGALLKTDTVSFLLGSGASKDCGGILIGRIPLELEKKLLEEGISGQINPRIRKWLLHFYRAVQQESLNDNNIPTTRGEIIQRRATLDGRDASPLGANYESVLSLLYRWRGAMPKESGRIRIDMEPSVDIHAQDLELCLQRATMALANCCRLPRQGAESGFEVYKKFISKILTRPLNLKRTNIFSLNYDTLVEKAADAEGVVLIDGFIGTLERVFRPECYDQDLYYPAETTEGRVHRHDRVAHLYKLHGSITWHGETPACENPYGLVAKSEDDLGDDPVIIYPTPTKVGESLGMPYAELFRRFATSVVRAQSTLFVIGYGFGDEHVNAIIRQAMAVPSFTLVVIDPKPENDFMKKLRERKDQRVWLFSGETLGTFSGFVELILPDLRDEDVRRQVMATYRALRPNTPLSEEVKIDG